MKVIILLEMGQGEETQTIMSKIFITTDQLKEFILICIVTKVTHPNICETLLLCFSKGIANSRHRFPLVGAISSTLSAFAPLFNSTCYFQFESF